MSWYGEIPGRCTGLLYLDCLATMELSAECQGTEPGLYRVGLPD